MATFDYQAGDIALADEASLESRIDVLSVKASFNQGDMESQCYSYWSGKILCQTIQSKNNAGTLDLSFPIGFGEGPSSLYVRWTTLMDNKMTSSGPIFISLVNENAEASEAVSWARMKGSNDPSLRISLTTSPGKDNEYTNEDEVEGKIVVWLGDNKETICLPLAELRIPERSLILRYVSDKPDEHTIELKFRSMRIVDFDDDTWELIVKNGNKHVNLPSDPDDAVCRSFMARTDVNQADDSKSLIDLQCAVLQAYRAGDIDAKNAKQVIHYFDSNRAPGNTLDNTKNALNRIRCSEFLNTIRKSDQTIPQAIIPLLDINRNFYDRSFPAARSSGRRTPPSSYTPRGPEVTYYVRPVSVKSSAASKGGKIRFEYVPDGTSGHPYRTIVQAYNAAKAIDSRRVELIVDGGYYDEQLNLDRNTILRAMPGSRPMIGSTIVCTRSLQLDITGFVLLGAPSPGALQVLVPGSSVSLIDVEIRGAQRYGIYQRGGEIELRSVTVHETRRERGQIEYGTGIVLQEGVQASMSSVTSTDNESFGIVLRGRDSYLCGTRVVVQRNKLHTDFYSDAVRHLELPVGAFLIDDYAVANLSEIGIHENEFVSLGAYHNAEITMDNVIVDSSRSLRMESEVEGGALSNFGGIGILAKNGAHITMRNLLISDNSLLGVGLYLSGEIDLHIGDVCRNTVGAYLAEDLGPFNRRRLCDDVRYFDNGRNLDGVSLPVPDTDTPEMGD